MYNFNSEVVADGIRINTISITKFKTTTIALYIHNNLDEYATYNALIPKVLMSGSSNFKSRTEISEFLEDMYGAVLESDIIKKGEIQSALFYLQCISDRYTQGDRLLFGLIDLLADIILNPLTQNNGFIPEYVNIEKSNLKTHILSRINDKAQYAVDRCLETVSKGEPFERYKYGEVDVLDNINEYNLYNHYKKIISTSPIDIFIVGDIKSCEIKSYIKEKFKISGRSPLKLCGLNISNTINEIKVVNENMDINQGKLCLGYRTGISFTGGLYPILLIYISILGGGLHSKLFQNVREKEGLAYYAYCGIEKFKSLMIISCGIDAIKYDRAVEIIKKQVDDMNKGNISDYEMDSSIKKLKNDLISINDSASMIIDYFLGGILYGVEIKTIEMVMQIEKVDKKQVIKLAQDIKLDTIYFLKPYDKEDLNEKHI